MKKLLFLLMLTVSLSAFSQIPAYYNDVNLNQTGTALKDALSVKIINTHTTNLSYTPGVWNALKQTDLDPNDNTKVLLIYGYSDTDGNYRTDRTRSKNANGGSAGTQWNREHSYAKSLGTPNLGTSGPGADAHHLRPADISFNGQRSSKKFITGTGNAGDRPGGWYPGDEWKGDVARMMMYMYLRYGNRCKPTGVGIGATVTSDPNMIQLFLQWNVEDPVSAFEQQRNPILEGIQGNRNPFIDNPAFATQIWGGPQAEDLFNGGTPDTQAPTVPTALTATSITQTSVTLSWNASTDNIGVTGYTIFNGAIQIGTSTTTNFSVTGLTANTTYSFSVKAYDAAGNVSNASNTTTITTASGTPDTQAPTTPTSFAATNITQTSVALSWNASTDNVGVTGYTIFNGAVQIGTSTTTSFSVTGLTAATTYTFTVKAYDTAGNVSNASNTLNITTLANSGGGNATDLFISEYIEGSSYNKALEIANFTGTSVNLTNYTLKKVSNGGGSWSAPLTLTGQLTNGSVYVVAHSSATAAVTGVANQLSSGSVISFNGNDAIGLFKNNILIDLIGNINSSANFAKNKTLQRKSTVNSPNTIYTVSEWNSFPQNTFNGLGNHTFSGGGTTPDTTAPTAPTSLAAANVTQTSVNLSWNASTDNTSVTGYNLYQGVTKIATITGTAYAVTGLTANTTYSFSVKAFDAAGNVSTTSNTVSVTTLSTPDTTAPTAPTNLAAANVTQTSVNLSWNTSTDNTVVTGYDVYQGATKIATITGTAYTVTGLTTNTTYNFSVKAFDAAGNVSNASNTVNVTTLATPDTTVPTSPTSLAAANVTQTSVNLSWNASTDNTAVTGYDVYQGATKIATITGTAYTVTGLTANTTYSFSVKAFDAAGNVSTASNTVSVTTLVSTVTYCASQGTNINYEYIDYVGIGGIANTTGANGGYGDFTAQTGNLPYGTNTIILSIGFASSPYTEVWRVWIDFNQNGTFETSEEVVAGSTSNAGNLSYNFTVPTSALAGNTRMRVSMKWNGTATACGSFTYGEVEDYTVNIGGAAAARGGKITSVQIDGKLGNEKSIFDATIFPNPNTSHINIKLRDNRYATFKIINITGQTVLQGEINHDNINVRSLKPGVYLLKINDGQRSFTKKIMKQ